MDAYKLYLDKANHFQCKLELEGASLDNAHARIILEGKARKYLFEGNISDIGQCEINLDGLKELFKDGDVGTMKLEVIADDAYFAPWESPFHVDVSKKVRVEVVTPTEAPKKPSISVNVVTPQQKEFKTIVESVSTKLKKNGIDLQNVKNNKAKITKMVAETIKTCSYNHDVGTLITEIVKSL